MCIKCTPSNRTPNDLENIIDSKLTRKNDLQKKNYMNALRRARANLTKETSQIACYALFEYDLRYGTIASQTSELKFLILQKKHPLNRKNDIPRTLANRS